MTKKELQQIVYLSVKKVFKEEVKPLIEQTIKREFYKILSEAEETKPAKREIMVEDNKTSLMSLIDEDENQENDSARAEINEKIFQGKTPFADVLNQTARDVKNRTGIYSNPMKQVGGSQMKVKLNDQSAMVAGAGLETTAPSNAQMTSRSDLAAKMGYGNIDKVGTVKNIPGLESKPNNKVQQIIQSDPTPVNAQPLNEVELPTQNADGKPINYANVPMDLVQNMMKNYSGLMNKVDKKAKEKRPV